MNWRRYRRRAYTSATRVTFCVRRLRVSATHVNCKRSDCSEKEKYARGGGGRCEDRERCFGFKFWDGMYYRRVSIRVSHSRVDEVRWPNSVGVDSDAATYTKIRLLAFPAAIACAVMQSAHLATEDPYTPLKATLVAAAVNGLGDFIAVFCFNAGIAGWLGHGALAQIVVTTLFVRAMVVRGKKCDARKHDLGYRLNGPPPLRLPLRLPSLKAIGRIGKIATPVFFTDVSESRICWKHNSFRHGFRTSIFCCERGDVHRVLLLRGDWRRRVASRANVLTGTVRR